MQFNKFSLVALAAFAIAREGEPGTDGSGAAATTAPAVPAAPNGYVDMQKQTFHFKTEKLRDEKGTVVGEGKKHPKTDLYLPIPKADRLVQILQGGEEFAKERELLMSAVTDVVYAVARGQINDFRENNKDGTVTAAALNYDKLDWTAIANTPAGQRGTSVPSDEEIQAFLDSYLEVMPALLEKDKSKIENHVALFKAGFKKQRGQKDFLEVFKNALLVYASNVPEDVVEDHSAVIEYYSNRLERMLSAEEKITLNDI